MWSTVRSFLIAFLRFKTEKLFPFLDENELLFVTCVRMHLTAHLTLVFSWKKTEETKKKWRREKVKTTTATTQVFSPGIEWHSMQSIDDKHRKVSDWLNQSRHWNASCCVYIVFDPPMTQLNVDTQAKAASAWKREQTVLLAIQQREKWNNFVVFVFFQPLFSYRLLLISFSQLIGRLTWKVQQQNRSENSGKCYFVLKRRKMIYFYACLVNELVSIVDDKIINIPFRSVTWRVKTVAFSHTILIDSLWSIMWNS